VARGSAHSGSGGAERVLRDQLRSQLHGAEVEGQPDAYLVGNEAEIDPDVDGRDVAPYRGSAVVWRRADRHEQPRERLQTSRWTKR